MNIYKQTRNNSHPNLIYYIETLKDVFCLEEDDDEVITDAKKTCSQLIADTNEQTKKFW